jgi:pimeloyl-ACP methyl ester carboxylesterase
MDVTSICTDAKSCSVATCSAFQIDIALTSRTVIVLLHGFGGQAVQWKHQLTQFSVHNRVIALDLRGHGQSDKPQGGYEPELIQRDLETALQQLGVKRRFCLIGHSFGGALATDFALRHPDRVDRLVLIATPGEFRLNAFFRIGLHLPAWLLRMIQPLTRGYLPPPYAPSRSTT